MTLKWAIYTNYFILVFIHPCKVSATALAGKYHTGIPGEKPGRCSRSDVITDCLCPPGPRGCNSDLDCPNSKAFIFFFISPPLYNFGACWYKHSNTTIRIETLKKNSIMYFLQKWFWLMFSLKCCKKKKHQKNTNQNQNFWIIYQQEKKPN